MRTTPSFVGLRASTVQASLTLARVKSRNTKCELILRRKLRDRGFTFENHSNSLPGRPDFVFRSARLVVFCDGDFWHGRRWQERRRRLRRGTNAQYWIAKIQANMRRDRRQSASLRRLGWKVLRVWESEVLRNPERVVRRILRIVRSQA